MNPKSFEYLELIPNLLKEVQTLKLDSAMSSDKR